MNPISNTEWLQSAHPIEPAVRERILQNLAAIEAQHQVKVIFACESGSRGWGFASPDSDYDVRFIYVPRLPHYLTVHAPRDVIELPIDAVLDINGWDVRKALGLLAQSNPTLIEWLRSPIIYTEEAQTMRDFRALVQSHYSRVKAWYHYASMAKKNFREHLQGESVRYKKYLYVLRPLLAARWIREHEAAAPMRFAELAQHTLHAERDAALIAEINALLEVKMRVGESATSPRWQHLHDFITQELAHNAAQPLHEAAPAKDYATLDAYLHDTVLRYNAP